MQFNFPVIDPLVTSGTELAEWLNAWAATLESQHSGVARPPYAIEGMLWLDKSGGAAAWKLKFFDGAQDIEIATLDSVANISTPANAVALDGNGNLLINHAGVSQIAAKSSNDNAILLVNCGAGKQALVVFQEADIEKARLAMAGDATDDLVFSSAAAGEILRLFQSGDVGIAKQLLCAASAAARASLRIPHGAAPTTPANGDVWTTATGMFVRLSGVTKNVVGALPTRTVLTSGAGTYTTPPGCVRLLVRLIGGGGSGASTGASGTATTFGPLTAGGGQGAQGQGGEAGAGGTASGGDINIPGNAGCSAIQASAGVSLPGLPGGQGVFGGVGKPGITTLAGSDSAPNSGAGGSSDGVPASTNQRPSGGAGAYCEKSIIPPAASYAYAVGAGGVTGAGGRAGGSGIIIIDEFYV